MHYRKTTVKFEGPIYKGKRKATWQFGYNSDPDMPGILRLAYPDGQLLLPEKIVALDQIEDKAGFQDPMTVIRTAAISVGSLVLGGVAVDSLLDLAAVEAARADLIQALENLYRSGAAGAALEVVVNGQTSVEEALKAFVEALPSERRAIMGVVAGTGSIILPSSYAGYALSRRTIRLQIVLDDGEHLTIRLPEFAAAFLLGAFVAASAGVTSPPDETPAEDANASPA